MTGDSEAALITQEFTTLRGGTMIIVLQAHVLDESEPRTFPAAHHL